MGIDEPISYVEGLMQFSRDPLKSSHSLHFKDKQLWKLISSILLISFSPILT